MTRRARLGTWLEQFPIIRPWLLRYSFEYPEGTYHYINWLSGTLSTRKGRSSSDA